MFIVYSPEGRNKVSSVQQLPVQKLSSVKRVNRVTESGLQKLNTEESTENKPSSLNPANVYKKNQQTERRQISKAAQLMSNPVIVISPEASLEYAWNLMQQEAIKHLPVIENDEVVGMCSQEGLLRRLYFDDQNQLKGELETPVSNIMQTMVVTTSADTDIRPIAQALTDYDIDALVVMDSKQQVKGIITEQDLISRLANEPPLELYI